MTEGRDERLAKRLPPAARRAHETPAEYPPGRQTAIPAGAHRRAEFSADHGDGVRSARAPRAPRRFARSDGGIRGRAHRRGAVHGAVFRARDDRGHALCDRGRRIRLRAAAPSVRGVLRAADQTLPRRSHRLAVPAPPAALHLRRSGGRGGISRLAGVLCAGAGDSLPRARAAARDSRHPLPSRGVAGVLLQTQSRSRHGGARGGLFRHIRRLFPDHTQSRRRLRHRQPVRRTRHDAAFGG